MATYGEPIMAILTHMCPHCGTEHVALRIVSVATIPGDRGAVFLQCPKCRLPSCASLKARPSRNHLAVGQFAEYNGDIEEMGWAPDQIWPEPPKPNIPELLPPDVARVYLQAERNFPVAGNEEAAGMMYGKALDIGLKKIDPTLKGMLGQNIKQLAKAGKLTADIAEWSGHVRDIRNDATHEESSISRDELSELRNFTEMVLRYLFSLPNAVKKRRGEKLEWESDDA